MLLECLWIEKLTHNLVSGASYIDETLKMRLILLYGKGLMEKFDYCKINSCFELVKPVHTVLGMNTVTALLLQILGATQ